MWQLLNPGTVLLLLLPLAGVHVHAVFFLQLLMLMQYSSCRGRVKRSIAFVTVNGTADACLEILMSASLRSVQEAFLAVQCLI